MIASAWFWGSLGALGVGFTLAYATRFGASPQEKAWYRARKAVVLPLSSNFVLVAVAAGWIFTQGRGINVSWVETVAGVLAVSFCCFRFPRAVGLPLLGGVVIVAASLAWNLRTSVAAPADAVLATSRLLAETSSGRTIEVRGLKPGFWPGPETRNVDAGVWEPKNLRVVTLPEIFVGLPRRFVETTDQDFFSSLVSSGLILVGWEKTWKVPAPSSVQLFHLWELSLAPTGEPVWTQRLPRSTLD